MSNSSLGKALLRSRFSKSKKIREPGGSQSTERWVNNIFNESKSLFLVFIKLTIIKKLHTSELAADDTDWNKLNLNSVTEQNSLDEFLTTAELAGTDFESGLIKKLFVNFINFRKRRIYQLFVY
jgi:hypothetical protein